jgi:hypothetical protein
MARIAISDLRVLIGDIALSRYQVIDGTKVHHPDYELKPLDSGGGATWGELALEIEMAAGHILELVATLRKISANKSEHPCWQESSL